ncbi:MAG TPA: ComEC/Rec2 family competence protein, partial [Candidatus Paceibacterota bacterium]|nr:ComEC/Rec2 family competence protein [Candidatus Paceibacterota bacterium]
PSFILSVLATFGLITLSPTVEKYLTFIPEKFGVRSIAATTIAVQIFVLPALLYMSGILSFLSVPANIIALPFVPLTMIFGFFAGLLGLLHPALALPFVLLTDLLLNVVMIVAETARALPYAYTTIPAFSLWIVTFAYIPLVFIAFKLFQGAELHKKVTKK